MIKSCLTLILLLVASAVFSAVKIELQSDKSASAEIAEDKGKQLVFVSLTFRPVSMLDAVSNDEMTEVLARFFAEEALSSHLKHPKTVAFSKVKCTVHKKTDKQCSLTYEIPFAAISDVEMEKHSISAESIRKYFASASSDTLLQDFRSTCFHDLRIAEAVFLEQIKTCKNREQLALKIKQAFSALEKKIDEDDALFLSEKEELRSKAERIRLFLLSKIASAEQAESSLSEEMEKNRQLVRDFTVRHPFDKYILSDKSLLTVGGCHCVETDDDGSVYLITVGTSLVVGDSPADKIDQKENAEIAAYGELAKHANVSVTYFSTRMKESSSDGKGDVKFHRKTGRKITIHSGTYINNLPTVGSWRSKDGKLFFLAKGKLIKKGRRSP